MAYAFSEEESLERSKLESLQRQKLEAMLRLVMATNAFYGGKFRGLSFDAATDPLEKLPFTTRGDIERDQAAHPPYGTNLTYPLESYCRLHQTSGTGGRAVRWLDNAESWNWFKRCWRVIYAAAGVSERDRFLFPFSFGPFIGFWAAFESALAMGSLAVAAGGMTTAARLRMIVDNGISVLGFTPTYALRMAEVAAEEKIDLRKSSVRRLIVAGEPGGSIPATRQRIESAWGAELFDHTGMTEIGSLGFECEEGRPGAGVHLIESECIAEVIDPATGAVLPEGEPGELVLTNLGRIGSPLIRYRTGDRVQLTRERCACGRSFARMIGGIQGRIDDMIVIRGSNVFPSALEAIFRQFDEIAEFQIQVIDVGALAQVRIVIEPAQGAAADHLPRRVSRQLQDTLHFHADVQVVEPGTLPRPEMKSRRIIRQRSG
jgi:phenylacetate-CoA ligase